MRPLFIPAIALALHTAVSLPAHAADEIDAAQTFDSSALAELLPDGLPSLLTPQAMASVYRLPAGTQSAADRRKPPTRIDYSEGPLRWNVGTNVTTRQTVTSIVPPTSLVPDFAALGGGAGGAGEVRGQLLYAGKEWEVFGAHTYSVVQGDGLPPQVLERSTIGGLYKLPDARARIAASVDFVPSAEQRARIEYRLPVGSGEGFVAAEQAFPVAPSAPKPPPTVRTGLNQRF